MSNKSKLMGVCYKSIRFILEDNYDNCVIKLNEIKEGLTKKSNDISIKLKYNNLTGLFILTDKNKTDEWERYPSNDVKKEEPQKKKSFWDKFKHKKDKKDEK